MVTDQPGFLVADILELSKLAGSDDRYVSHER